MLSRIIFKIKCLILGISNEQLSLDAHLKAGLKVGKNCSGLLGCIIDHGHAWLIEIGDNVVFAPQVYLLAHDTSTKKIVGATKIAKLKIANNCFIGARAIILSGVTVGKNSIVGAGSVVTKDVPANVVVAGNPAKIITDFDSYSDKVKADFSQSFLFDETYTLNGGITPQKKTRNDYKNIKNECLRKIR